MKSAIYRKAKDVLFQKGWTQKIPTNDKGEVCILQAIHMAAIECNQSVLQQGTELWDARAFLEGSVLKQIAWSWNDDHGRTFDQVIEVLDKAEKMAEEQEALSASK